MVANRVSIGEKILKKEYSVKIAKPNIGYPFILQIDPKLKETSFVTKILIATDITNAEICETLLKENIELIPILDYKLELKFLLEKKQEEQERKEKQIKKARRKKRGFWAWLFRRKKKDKLSEGDISRLTLEGEQIASEIRGMEEKLEKLKPRIYRADAIKAKIFEVVPVTPLEIHNSDYLHEQERPQGYLIKHKTFGNSYFFYRVSFRFLLTEEVVEFLKHRNFVMFDIVLKLRDFEEIINYHSLVISKQDWNNFKIIHATDLHLADRNDRIYSIVKAKAETNLIQGANKIYSELKKLFTRGSSDIKILQKPLRKRLINPNNQFRRFIKVVNRKVLNNEIDFIVLTGDLIDFTLLSQLRVYKNIKEIKKFLNFKYEDSNWQIFNNIVLNKPSTEKLKGVLKGQELICPIFTIPGNHDYRPYAYDLTWAGLYKKIGLNASEAAALNEFINATPATAIAKTPLALKGYSSQINSSLDYYFKLGNNIFIFLDSGSDSFKNFRDFISGHPSLTGLSHRQIGFLENIINYKYQKGDNIFLFIHGPPLNTSEKRSIIKRLQRRFGKQIKIELEEFRESVNQKKHKKTSKYRLDGNFNVKFGTVSRNWEKLVKFCKDFCILTLAGHTHKLREFRLKDPEEKTTVYNAPPFSLKKIENPAAVFYDLYSELYTNPKDIEEYGPFVVQTPALGLGGYKNPKLAGGYRIISIEKGKLASFKVEYLAR